MKSPAPSRQHTKSLERGTSEPIRTTPLPVKGPGQSGHSDGAKSGPDNSRQTRRSGVLPMPARFALSDPARVLIRWMIAEKGLAMSELSRHVGYSQRHLRKVLSGQGKVDPRRFDRLMGATVSPWFTGIPLDALHGATLHDFDQKLLSPVAKAGVLDPTVPPRSHVGLDGAVLLASASSGEALNRRYPWTTRCGQVLRRFMLPHRGGSLLAVIRRHHQDRPEAEDDKPYALRYAQRFDVRVPALGKCVLAVIRIWPKNRTLFGTAHDIHVKLNGSAFRLGVAVPLLHELLRGVAAPDSIVVHSLDVALDIEAPYGALAAFQGRRLPGVGYFRSLAAYGRAGTATGVIYGGPSGHHRVVIYDKLAEIAHRARSRGIAERPEWMRDWLVCTRFEYRLFPHRFGTSNSPHDCLVSMPKVWTTWDVADMRHLHGACPALLYLASVREFGHLHFAPTAKTVRRKVQRAMKRAKDNPSAMAPTTLSASERVSTHATSIDRRTGHRNARRGLFMRTPPPCRNAGQNGARFGSASRSRQNCRAYKGN